MLFRSFRNRNRFSCSHIFGKGLPDSSRSALSPIVATWVFPRVTLMPPSKVDAGAMTPVNHCITKKALLLPLKAPSLQSQPSPSTEHLQEPAHPFLRAHLTHLSLLHFFFTEVQLVGMLVFPKHPNPPFFPVHLTSISPDIVTSKPPQSKVGFHPSSLIPTCLLKVPYSCCLLLSG